MRHASLVCALCAGLVAGSAGASGPSSGTIRARLVVSPLSVVVVVPPDPVKAGKAFRIHAEVANAGSGALQNVAVTLLSPQALILRDPVTQLVPRIGARGARSVHWDACTATPGGYVVMARANAGPFTVESTGQLIQITSAKRPTC